MTNGLQIIMPSFYPYLQLYKDYAQRYLKAQETFTQCLETSKQFKELIELIEVYMHDKFLLTSSYAWMCIYNYPV